MFEKLFTRCELQRYLGAPFFDERARYLAYWEELGAAHASLQLLATYQLVILKYLDLADGRLITPEEVHSAGDCWAEAQTARKAIKHPWLSRRRFISFATRWLQFLGRLKVAPEVVHPYANVLLDFAAYMSEEKLLAAETVKLRCERTSDFLKQLWQKHIQLSDVTINDIDRIVASKRENDGWARSTIRGYVEVLRGFLEFAEKRGLCAAGLGSQLIAPRLYKGENLPAGPSWEEVEKLCANAETDRRADIRDRAIILLFAVYGLRVAELWRLTLDDLDWENETVRIRRSKQVERIQVYPLSQVVGEAILRYLKEVRLSCQFRELFLQLNAPIRPLSRAAITRMVRMRQQALGIRLQHYGPHALRHACASRLLAQGLSMKAIGDHLGHRSISATGIYAKVDLGGLREVGDFSLEGLV